MDGFEIEFGRITRLADSIDGYSSELKRQKSRVESIAGQLVFGENYRGIQQALSMIAVNMNIQQTQLQQYGGVLETIVKTYKGTESEIAAAVGEVK